MFSFAGKDQNRHFDSLYVFGCNGVLVEHPLEPRHLTGVTKLNEDSPLDLNLTSRYDILVKLCIHMS